MPLPFTALAQFIADHFDRSGSLPAPKLDSAIEIGAYGERVAAAFLRRHGYRILTRNYATTGGEIDLVCRCENILVFVEVRTRGGEEFGRPAESIDDRKQEALRHAAARYLELLERDDIHHRFDAVEVMYKPGTIPECSLLVDLFS